jgi:hypothetical protein
MPEALPKLQTQDRPFRIGYKGGPVRLRAIINALENNCSLTSAATAGGISLRTLQTWCERNPDLRRMVEDARARAEAKAISGIMSAGLGKETTVSREVLGKDGEVVTLNEVRTSQEWQALAWWLERTFPDRYGRRDRLSVGGDAGAPPVRIETASNDVALFLEAFREDPAAVLAAVRAQKALSANSSAEEQVVDADFREESAIDRIPTDQQPDQM